MHLPDGLESLPAVVRDGGSVSLGVADGDRTVFRASNVSLDRLSGRYRVGVLAVGDVYWVVANSFLTYARESLFDEYEDLSLYRTASRIFQEMVASAVVRAKSPSGEEVELPVKVRAPAGKSYVIIGDFVANLSPSLHLEAVWDDALDGLLPVVRPVLGITESSGRPDVRFDVIPVFPVRDADRMVSKLVRSVPDYLRWLSLRDYVDCLTDYGFDCSRSPDGRYVRCTRDVTGREDLCPPGHDCTLEITLHATENPFSRPDFP